MDISNTTRETGRRESKPGLSEMDDKIIETAPVLYHSSGFLVGESHECFRKMIFSRT